MEKVELLAPAGDVECGYAALFYGADAVYLGLQAFSARATAVNFDADDLNNFVGYAHATGKKVYVAVNTLVKEVELPELFATLDLCKAVKVDGLIIQDLGVANIVRRFFPELEMHASTQMVVHNKAGALELQKLGFKRVVLARELSLPEIKEIAAIPALETEVFVHGALCYSYSGLCLFSALAFGRSANRGRCLYPCRLPFQDESGREAHLFSMKDLALEEDILKLPVTSLKIEGRKKNALYVAAVTDYYRHILNTGKADAGRAENIKQIFSREWSKFHFTGKVKNVTDTEFVGHRGLPVGEVQEVRNGFLIFKTTHKIARFDGLQIDVGSRDKDDKPFGFSVKSLKIDGRNVFEAAAGERVMAELPADAPFLARGKAIYLASSSEVKGAYNRYTKPKPNEFKTLPKIDIEISVFPDKVIAVADNSAMAEIKGNFTEAKNKAKNEEAFTTAFSKTRDYGFVLGNLTLNNKAQLFVPISELNNLRRMLAEQINLSFAATELPDNNTMPERKRDEPRLIIKTDEAEALRLIDPNDFAEIIFASETKEDMKKLVKIPKNKLRIALPPVCRDEAKAAVFITELLAMGFKKFEIGGLWALGLLPAHGIDVSFDASLYMLNSFALLEAKNMGASRVTLAIEDDADNMHEIIRLSQLPVALIGYQDVPLFTSAVCIKKGSCKGCDKAEEWFNLTQKNVRYQARVKNCQTMLFAASPMNKVDLKNFLKPDFYRLDFMYKKYSPEQVLDICQRFKEQN